MAKFITRTIIVALTVFGVSYVVPGITVNNFLAAVVFSLVLGLINVLGRPLIRLLTFPLRWLTFGLFTLVINTLLFWLAARFAAGVVVASFWAAFVGALLVGIVSLIVNQVFKKSKKS
ncbi:phage holin family protein [Patescibacteria group bacterium]|nr:phage holin family protein [Patescibacteria group bacterium]